MWKNSKIVFSLTFSSLYHTFQNVPSFLPADRFLQFSSDGKDFCYIYIYAHILLNKTI